MGCSINDIAREMNLSRNTISKALNGKSGVSAKTRKEIIEKATEMKYRSFLTNFDQENEEKGSILFLTKTNAHTDYWITTMQGIESELSGTGYKLVLGIITDEQLEKCELPSIVQSEAVKGIVLVELCAIGICKAVVKCGKPVVSIDYPSVKAPVLEDMDIVTMENQTNITKLITILAQKNCKRFAFAGNIFSENVSDGFIQRYTAYTKAVAGLGLINDDNCSFLSESQQYFMNFSYLIQRIKAMDPLPDAIICGNDWTALQLLQAFQVCQIQVGEKVLIAGFDNIRESSTCTPPLTTINSPKDLMGKAAVRCLLDRIETPDLPHVFIEFQTKLLLRGSTGDTH
jgi:LacI family transcriptional regulator